MIRDPGLHRRGDAQRLVDTPEVVIHEVERHGRSVVLDLLLKAFVSRVKRRIDIRIVRFGAPRRTWRCASDRGPLLSPSCSRSTRPGRPWPVEDGPLTTCRWSTTAVSRTLPPAEAPVGPCAPGHLCQQCVPRKRPRGSDVAAKSASGNATTIALPATHISHRLRHRWDSRIWAALVRQTAVTSQHKTSAILRSRSSTSRLDQPSSAASSAPGVVVGCQRSARQDRATLARVERLVRGSRTR